MTTVDLWELRSGDVTVTTSRSRARVKAATQDGEWVLAEYLVSDDGEAGGDDLIAADEIEALEQPAAPAAGAAE